MIWTEEENEIRQMDNLLNKKGKSCKTCQWSGYQKGDEFITCGHHLQNFSSDSFCAYWTDPEDPKLKEHQQKRREELKTKILNRLTQDK